MSTIVVFINQLALNNTGHITVYGLFNVWTVCQFSILNNKRNMSKYSLHVLVRNGNFKLVKLWMEFTNKLLFSFTCWVSNQNIVWGKMSHNHDNGCRLEPSSTTTSTEVESTNEKSKIKKKDGSKYVPCP